MIKFKCERCSAVITCPDANAGKEEVCPTCQHKQLAPRKAAPRHNKLVIVGGSAAVLIIIGWAAWAIMGTEEKPSAPKAPENKGTQRTRARAAKAPERRVGERKGTKTKEDPRDAAEKAWDEQKKLYEERRLSENRLKEWESRDAMEREAERIAKEMREEEKRQEVARREFERKAKLEQLEEERKRRQNP